MKNRNIKWEKQKCCVPGCKKKTYVKIHGLCSGHYYRYRINDDLKIEEPIRPYVRLKPAFIFSIPAVDANSISK